MVQSYICRMAESIVTIVLPQCMTATSQIVATIDVMLWLEFLTGPIKLIFLLASLVRENLNQHKLELQL